MYKAETLNQELLGSLARAIENPGLANKAEIRLIAMLLGIFQVFTEVISLNDIECQHLDTDYDSR